MEYPPPPSNRHLTSTKEMIDFTTDSPPSKDKRSLGRPRTRKATEKTLLEGKTKKDQGTTKRRNWEQSNTTPTFFSSVVVAGGGVSGSLIAKTLKDHAYVFLIDQKEYFEITWANLRSMVEPSFSKRTFINHSDYLHNVQVLASSATGITRNEVLTTNRQHVSFDYLVIVISHPSPGSHTKAERLNHYRAEQEKI